MVGSFWTAAAAVVFLCGGVGLPEPAKAQASFDCRRAGHPSEIAVCRDPGLASADRDLDAVFRSALERSADPDALRAGQRIWLGDLRNCGEDPYCLAETYADRTAELKGEDNVLAEVETEAPLDDGEARTEPVALGEDAEAATEAPLTIERPEAPSSLPAEPTEAPRREANTIGSPNLSFLTSPWMVAVGLGLFAMIFAAGRVLTISVEKYGYDMLFNRMAFLHVAVAICVGLAFTVPWLFAPIALATYAVIMVTNIRRTSFAVGFIGTLIQPLALLLTFVGIRWVTTAMKRVG